MMVNDPPAVFKDEDQIEVYKTETYNGAVHQLVIAELDGTALFELIELRSDEESNSILRVFGPISSD